MKFLNISDTKLKVTLTPEECRSYGIDTTKSEFSRSEIKGVIRDILSTAEDECGFVVTSDKILVQLYPMPTGECELFVTKLTGLSGKDRGIIRGVEGLRTMQKRRGIYRFDSKETLVSAVRAIYREGVECELYLDDGDKYYISINEDFTDGISEFEILIEYGERLYDMPLYVLSEYGSLILSENTLERILAQDFGQNGAK